MAYTKQNFVDGNTLFASQLNHMEDGIARLDNALTPESSPVYTPAQQSQMRTRLGAMATTPSGDPLHELYLLLGATYNAATSRWNIYDITDATNEDMQRAVLRGVWQPADIAPFHSGGYYDTVNKIRFNLPRTGGYNAELAVAAGFAQNNATLEVLNVTTRGGIISSWNSANVQVYTMQNFANGCTKLRKIIGQLRCGGVTNTTNAFSGCANLEEVWISLLPFSISFGDSPKLSKDSVLYMIQNAGTKAIVITLNATVYDALSVDSDIISALAAKPNVTLASV